VGFSRHIKPSARMSRVGFSQKSSVLSSIEVVVLAVSGSMTCHMYYYRTLMPTSCIQILKIMNVMLTKHVTTYFFPLPPSITHIPEHTETCVATYRTRHSNPFQSFQFPLAPPSLIDLWSILETYYLVYITARSLTDFGNEYEVPTIVCTYYYCLVAHLIYFIIYCNKLLCAYFFSIS
jgi:hypothetical protein